MSSIPQSISFIILALNEEKHVEATVNEVLAGVKASTVTDYEIVLVNDGSTDRTGDIMEGLAKIHQRIKVVHNATNSGLGGAYMSGLKVATCEYGMIVAGDNAMPASDFTAILSKLGDADIILPYMTNPKLRPLGRRIGSHGFTLVVNMLFGYRIKYYQGMLPRRTLVNLIEVQDTSYAFTSEIVIKLLQAGCSYTEVPTPNTPSKTGNSVALQPKRIFAVLRALLSLRMGIAKFKPSPKIKEVSISKKR